MQSAPEYWFRRPSRPGGTLIPSCWQGWAVVAAAPLAITLGIAGLAAVSVVAVLIGLPLIALAAIWWIGAVISRRLEPPAP
jgi:Na+/H+ antiporter NhaA